MALTLSASAQGVQKRPAFPAKVRIYYKRIYFSDATGAMTWETNWTMVPENEVEDAGRLIWQLDSDVLNVFKSSTATITLRNKDGKWKRDCNESVFAPDSNSWRGYVDYKTAFQIRPAFVLDDGTVEELQAFTGYLVNVAFRTGDPNTELVEIMLEGGSRRLADGDADDANQTVTDEYMGSLNGGGATMSLTTVNKGVSKIDTVKRGWQAAGFPGNALQASTVWEQLTEGLDYTTAAMNDPANVLTLNGLVVLTANSRIWITYRYYKRSQTIESLVTDLCTAAGLGVSEYSISAVSVPTGVINLKLWRSQADWQTAAKNFCMNIGATGQISPLWLYVFDNFEDGDYTANPAWTPQVGADWSVILGSGHYYLKGNGASHTSSVITTPQTTAVGTWRFAIQLSSATAIQSIFAFNWNSSTKTGSGYAVVYGNGQVQLIKVNSADITNSANWTVLGSVNHSSYVGTGDGSNGDIVWVSLDAYGAINVYIGNPAPKTASISVTDTTYTTTSNVLLGYSNPGGADSMYVDELHFSVNNSRGQGGTSLYEVPWAYLEMPAIDAGSGQPLEWDALELFWDSGFAAQDNTYAKVDTKASADNVSFDAFATATQADQIHYYPTSTTRRYLVPRIWLSLGASASEAKLWYKTSNIVVDCPDYAGKDCWSAIQQHAADSGCECGFNGAGVFFFRPKTPHSSADFTLDQSNALVRIVDARPIFTKVYSEVQLTYFGVTRKVNAGSENVTAPTPRQKYGRNILTLSSTNFRVINDANVSYGIGRKLFFDGIEPKWEIRAEFKFYPQVELGDVVQLSFDTKRAINAWFWGDTTYNWGDSKPYYRSQTALPVFNKKFRVISFEPVLKGTKLVTLLLREV